MSIDFPDTRTDVANRMKTDAQGQLTNSNPFLRNSFLGALIVSIAGRVFDFYYKVNRVLMPNLFPDTATGEYAERWGNIVGITRNAATQSNGYITAQGTALTIIPDGTQLQTSDGIILLTQASATITNQTISVSSLTQVSGTATATTASDHNLASNISVTIAGANETEYNGTFTIVVTGSDTFTYSVDAGAASPATGTITATFDTASIEVTSDDFGQDANVDTGSAVTFSSPIAGVNDTAYVQYDGLTGGTDVESDSDFRNRYIERWQNPVALFNDAAIETKAKEISGVTRVWVEDATPALGQVTIYFVRDNDTPIIPSAAEITAVKNNILTIKPALPADSDIIVNAPTAVTVNFTFTAISPDTTTMRTSIENNLEQLFEEDTEVGVNLLESRYLGAIINTIDTETGEKLDTFTLSSPSGDISISSGELAVLGTITF